MRLDLGFSFRNNAPVLLLILERLPATLLLMGVSIMAALALGVALGVTAARYVNRPRDNLISVDAVSARSTSARVIVMNVVSLG